MTAAEALPPVPSPWRDSSHLDHIPTAAELAACPPVDPSVREGQRRFLSALTTQAAWRPAPAPGVEPFTEAERREDLLDEAEGIWSGVYANGHPEVFLAGGRLQVNPSNQEDIAVLAAQYARVERLLDWPQNEKSGWE